MFAMCTHTLAEIVSIANIGLARWFDPIKSSLFARPLNALSFTLSFSESLARVGSSQAAEGEVD